MLVLEIFYFCLIPWESYGHADPVRCVASIEHLILD